MAVLVANHTGASEKTEYGALPERLRGHYELMSYKELIRPLVWRDRVERGKSWGQIAQYYSVSIMEARGIMEQTKRAPFCCGEES